MANDKKKKDIILDKEKVFKHYIDLNGDHTVLFAHGDFRVITHAKTKNGAYRACRRKILDYINSLTERYNSLTIKMLEGVDDENSSKWK